MKRFAALLAFALSTILAVTMLSAAPAIGIVAVTAAPSVVPASKQVESAVDRGKNRYRTPTGPFFNNPRGGPSTRFAIERQIVRAINHTPKRAYIRFALYSFDRIGVAQALLKARSRGVRVQILLNDHQDTRAMKMLRARLGKNRAKESFIYKCKSSCRGDKRKRHLHTKFYAFSRAGKSKDVLMVGSANLTLNAVKHQWNDLYLMSGNAVLFNQYIALFKDMKNDYDQEQPPFEFCGTPVGPTCDDSVDRYTTVVFPRRTGRHHDVVLQTLRKITCLTPKPGGGRWRTKLVLSMHTMRGNRGNYIAAAIRNKFAEGCNFRVSFGLIGFHTKGILGMSTRRGRIPLRSTGYDFHPDDENEVDRYTHQKYFVIRGNYNGNPHTQLTFTGSSNWASLGAHNDEVTFSIRGAAIARKYVHNFNFMWRPGNSRNAYTTTNSNFRLLRPGGKFWEND